MPEYIYVIKIKEEDKKVWRFLAAEGLTRLKVYALRYSDLAIACDVARRLEFDPGVTCHVRVLDDKQRVLFEMKRTGAQPIEVPTSEVVRDDIVLIRPGDKIPVDGVVVGLKTESERMTHDPNTAKVLCDNVKGLCLTLDPSHYIFGPHKGANYEQVMRYTCHVRLRDTNKDKFQVRVGQGQVEYGRLVTQLNKFGRVFQVYAQADPAFGGSQSTRWYGISLSLRAASTAAHGCEPGIT